MPWPGTAAVSVAVVHLAVGNPSSRVVTRVLDGRYVTSINSRLRSGVERQEAVALASNSKLGMQGVHTYGVGFVISVTRVVSL